jgi:hypothetical protein
LNNLTYRILKCLLRERFVYTVIILSLNSIAKYQIYKVGAVFRILIINISENSLTFGKIVLFVIACLYETVGFRIPSASFT